MIKESSVNGLVGNAISAISRRIRNDELMPGDRLPSEAQLSKDLDVSRTVVREALRSLDAIRIIDLAAGKRATVAHIGHSAMSMMIEHGIHTDQINIQQIYDVRRAIETRIVSLASIRRSDLEAQQILNLAHAMRAASNDPELLMENDLAFHTALARASRNPVFELLVGSFQQITRQTWPFGWKSRTTLDARETMIATHEAIASAIAKSDPHAAMDAMAIHFDESVYALLAAGMS